MLKVMDIRSGKEVKMNDVVDYGPPPKMAWFYPKFKVEHKNHASKNPLTRIKNWWSGDTSKETIPSITPDEKSKYQIPYPKEWHNSGFRVLDIKDLGWTEAWVKLQSLSPDEKVFWCPLIIKFLTRDGLRVGYIPS